MHTYTRTNAYIHTYIHTFTHTCMHTYIHTCMYTESEFLLIWLGLVLPSLVLFSHLPAWYVPSAAVGPISACIHLSEFAQSFWKVSALVYSQWKPHYSEYFWECVPVSEFAPRRLGLILRCVVCVCVCARARVCVCVCVRVRACARGRKQEHTVIWHT